MAYIFRDSLTSHLEKGERVEVDDGYIDEHLQLIKCPKGFVNLEETEFVQQTCRNRQETVNKRLKQFGVLKQRYMHDINMHAKVFHSCDVCV